MTRLVSVTVVAVALMLTVLGVEPARAVEAALAILLIFEAEKAICEKKVHVGAVLLAGALAALTGAATHAMPALVHAIDLLSTAPPSR